MLVNCIQALSYLPAVGAMSHTPRFQAGRQQGGRFRVEGLQLYSSKLDLYKSIRCVVLGRLPIQLRLSFDTRHDSPNLIFREQDLQTYLPPERYLRFVTFDLVPRTQPLDPDGDRCECRWRLGESGGRGGRKVSSFPFTTKVLIPPSSLSLAKPYLTVTYSCRSDSLLVLAKMACG